MFKIDYCEYQNMKLMLDIEDKIGIKFSIKKKVKAMKVPNVDKAQSYHL